MKPSIAPRVPGAGGLVFRCLAIATRLRQPLTRLTLECRSRICPPRLPDPPQCLQVRQEASTAESFSDESALGGVRRRDEAHLVERHPQSVRVSRPRCIRQRRFDIAGFRQIVRRRVFAPQLAVSDRSPGRLGSSTSPIGPCPTATMPDGTMCELPITFASRSL
jgi:hypothetical protein